MFSNWVLVFYPDNKDALPLHLAGMPDFLEKLHAAALRAKNLEVGIFDYTAVIKSSNTNRQPSQERLSEEKPHTGGPGQIYAWDGHLDQELCWCVFTLTWTSIKPSSPNFLGRLHELQMEVATYIKDYYTVCPSVDVVILVVDKMSQQQWTVLMTAFLSFGGEKTSP